MQGVSSKIHFYKKNESYYEFTNFVEGFPFQLDGKTWATSEHYFQASKFLDRKQQEYIRSLRSARETFEAVRDPELRQCVRKDWQQVKDEVMYKAVYAKFSQHPKLRKLLLDTSEAILVEHTSNDNYWADGGDGSGRNQLGKTLMRVRSELKHQE